MNAKKIDLLVAKSPAEPSQLYAVRDKTILGSLAFLKSETLPMKAIAWGAQRTVMTHTVATSAKLQNIKPESDGSLDLQFKTGEVALSGTFYVKLTFTAAEIDDMYRKSIAGTVAGLKA